MDKDIEKQVIAAGISIARLCWRKRWLNHMGTYDDALQEGILAALIALKRYDPNRDNCNLKSYITTCVYNHLAKVSIENRIIRVPRTGKNTPEAKKAFDITSLIEDLPKYNSAEQESYDIYPMISILDDKKRKFIRECFGIDCNLRTMDDIAKEEKLTKQAISKRRRIILERLRNESIY